ncbi:DUF2254 family protein [Bacillus coahuilensis]|uniref:DUF2254 family protein n=1 Tax=Bacillus coahuilensis TaxID=408580 RepID=UPI0009D6CFB1
MCVKRNLSFYCKGSHYLSRVDVTNLRKLALEQGIFIEFHHKIGEFMTTHQKVFTVYKKEEELSEELVNETADFITLSQNRSTNQDFCS